MMIQLSKCVSWQQYRETIYVFNESTKKVYLFSDSAKYFWKSILDNHDAKNCLWYLYSIYGDDSKDLIEVDFGNFVYEIKKYGLIHTFGEE